MTALTSLAAALSGRVLDTNHGPSIVVSGDLIYAGMTGEVKVDHRGRIIRLGCSWRDDVRVIVAAYRAATGVEAGAA